MLLREDVVIVATDANEENVGDERAVTEIPTQLIDANNTQRNNNNNIYSNQQQSYDVGIQDCVPQTPINDESLRRFPVMNEQNEHEQSTFLKPVKHVLKTSYDLAQKLQFVELIEPTVMRLKRSNINSYNLEDSPKLFPVFIAKNNTSLTFPCKHFGENPRENYDEPNKNIELSYKTTTAHRTRFPLYNSNETISHPNKFPSNLKENRANIMNAVYLANNITEFSTCRRSCHHNLLPPSTTKTTATTTTMTHYPVSNSGHPQRIQVQYNEQVLKQNGPDLKKIINCCVHDKPQQTHEEQQHVNDAKLAIATMAKNKTVATTTTSQNNDEHNIFNADFAETSASRELYELLSAHKLPSKNDQQKDLPTTTPPPMSEILAELLEDATDLLDAIGTLNKQTFYADSQLHRPPPTPATCSSDIRDSSSQEVPQREDVVSVKVITRTLPENKPEEYGLELLPKFYALERHDDGEKLIWTEIDQLIDGEQSKVNDDKREAARETEVLVTLSQFEATSEPFVSEPSVNIDKSEQQTDEMKFEMKSVKSNVPETETMRRHSHTYKNEPNIASLGVVGQRPVSASIGGTRTPLIDSKYSRVSDQSSALKNATTLHGSVPTGVPLPVKYARGNEQYSASRPASNVTPVSVTKDSKAPVIDTKYRRPNDESSASRIASAYVGARTANLDTKYARTNDEQSALRTAVRPARNSSTLIDTKFDRNRDEASASKFANSLYGKNYEPSVAKHSSVSRTGYGAPLVDSKYGKNDELSATNRSNLLLASSRATNVTSLLNSKYAKHDDSSAASLATMRPTNTPSLLDSKYAKTNDEPNATKLSTVLRTDNRPSSLIDTKYAKINDESSTLKHPHSAARLTDATPLVDSTKYARTYVEPNSAINELGTRSISVDGLSAAIPKSTRLRRQRRMHSQSSQDQPEDTIERLNRLRARISGALSEVKGVLKHYSTETELEVEAEKQSEDVGVNKSEAPVAKVDKEQETQQKNETEENEGPVRFRFVKKVRRRSFFDEGDEDKEKQAEELAKPVSTETEKTNEAQIDNVLESQSEVEVEVNKTEEKAKEQEVAPVVNGNLLSTMPELIVSTSSVEAISKDQQEEKPSKETPILEDIQESPSIDEANVTTDATAPEPTTTEADITVAKKPKKKILVKKDVNRRASIAAVEVSKIEPPITPTLSLNIKAQRRPSDSEAILKKKVTPKITATTTTTGETASKVKIIHKVKRPSVKHTNTIPTDQNKTITSEAAAAPTAASQSENNNSRDINDRANFSSKATTLAAQLVIDDASLTNAATKDGDSTSLATIGLEEANAVMVAATPLSPLRVSETNSQTKAVAKTAELATLGQETVTVGIVPKTPTTPDNLIPAKIPKLDDSSAVSCKLINDEKVEARLKSAVTENAAEKINQSQQEREGEKLIDQKIIPAHSTVIKNGWQRESQAQSEQQQQVADKTAVLQAPSTFTSKPPDVIAIASEIAKEPTLPTPPPSPTLPESIIVDTTKTGNTATTINSAEATLPSDTSSAATTEAAAAAMPELQVKALQAFLKPSVPAPFNVAKDECIKKKVVIRKLLRKNSTEKTQKSNLQTVPEEQKNTTNTAVKDKSKKLIPAEVDNCTTTQPIIENITTLLTDNKLLFTTNENKESNEDDWIGEVNEDIEEPIEEKEPVPEKKKRRIKKKVIIKRQPRKLSISDTFFKGPESEPSSPIEETLEKPVEYVKVDSEEEQDYEEIVKPIQPTRSCLKLREFQVGDRVMYAERYRKTQVRWKKGIVLERITSISYKLEVEGKEVPAHISYIKKFTERKVNFSGKEYLEIDYEQIAEEEEKARNYSIWNMV